MLIEHDGKRPKIDPSARIAPTAVLCGDVTIGPGTSVGFGAVLSAESGPIAVGAHCMVMDNAVVRGTRRYPVTIGDRVLIGPQASLSGCTVADDVFFWPREPACSTARAWKPTSRSGSMPWCTC